METVNGHCRHFGRAANGSATRNRGVPPCSGAAKSAAGAFFPSADCPAQSSTAEARCRLGQRLLHQNCCGESCGDGGDERVGDAVRRQRIWYQQIPSNQTDLSDARKRTPCQRKGAARAGTHDSDSVTHAHANPKTVSSIASSVTCCVAPTQSPV